MCGIAGLIHRECQMAVLEKMGMTIAHRGPDDTGYFCSNGTGMVQKRLSIVDIENGTQPVFNEKGSVLAVFNGEIYNHMTLRKQLERLGHVMSNNSDTAVLPHMYEEYGNGMFERLSGQFAIALYDIAGKMLLLARDRLGIKPLYFSPQDAGIVFGSEIKAILASGIMPARLCHRALFDTFTFWSPQKDLTVFEGIYCLLPGEYLEYRNSETTRTRYWKPVFGKAGRRADSQEVAGEVEALLEKAVSKRLMGDVAVSAYLSGGIDSSLITALAARAYSGPLEAFSITFENDVYDEYPYQKKMCEHLGIRHNTVAFSNSQIPEMIRKSIYHIEAPLLRAAPLPLLKLSGLVNSCSRKVVLSGEGADEFFGGYDIFREVKIRNYIRAHPRSEIRKRLFEKINLFVQGTGQAATAGGLNYFYMNVPGDGLLDSHYTRWRQFMFFKRFFSHRMRAMADDMGCPDYLSSIDLPDRDEMQSWTDIQKSQYLETVTFLSPYLLASQGDRVAMANSVEARFPFLDDSLVSYSMDMEDRFKIRALNEKYVIRSIASKYLPNEIICRKKFPYRSPVDISCLLENEYLKSMLSARKLAEYDIFDPVKTAFFIEKSLQKSRPGERDMMLIMGLVTTQVLCDVFSVST